MTMQVTEAGIREKLARVRENVAGALERSGRGPEDLRILVASKYYSAEQIGALSAVGVDLVGENRCDRSEPPAFRQQPLPPAVRELLDLP